jgi:hypothetical protein
MPQLWKPPDVISTKVPEGGEDCPKALSPQQATAPFD